MYTVNMIIVLVVIGAIAGWLAGYIATRNTTLDWKDLVLGIVGSFVGNKLIGLVTGTDVNTFSALGIISAVLGALLVAWIYRKVTGNSAM